MSNKSLIHTLQQAGAAHCTQAARVIAALERQRDTYKRAHDKMTNKALKLQAEVARKDEALRAAKQFIENGVEGGFIRMPDPDTPDTAHNTLPKITAALEARND